MDCLKGKNVLITGATKRLGRAMVTALAQRGLCPIIHSRPTEQAAAHALQREIQSSGVQAWTISADFANITETQDLFKQIRREIGQVHLLINNASIFPSSRLSHLSLADLEQTMRVNAYAPLILSQDFASQTSSGCIINILDTRIKRYDMTHAGYQLSKSFLYVLTEMMAREFAPGIRVNGVAPGLILPPPGKDETYLQSKIHQNLLEKVGTTQDIVDAVIYLLSSPFMTGQILFVDGGQHFKGD